LREILHDMTIGIASKYRPFAMPLTMTRRKAPTASIRDLLGIIQQLSFPKLLRQLKNLTASPFR
jgi:hypothetical protein